MTSRQHAFESSPALRWSRFVLGLFVLIAVVVIATHLGEGEKLLTLLRHVQPLALLAAVLLQCGTYFCVALILNQALAHEAKHLPVLGLVPLALARQFVMQAVPSIGLSGNLMMITGLQRRGIPRVPAVRAVLVCLVSNFLAFAIGLVAAIAILWALRDLRSAFLLPLTLMMFLVVVASVAVFWLGARAEHILPARVRRWLIERDLEELCTESGGSHWNVGLLVVTTSLQLAVTLLDSATLYVVLAAIGVHVGPAVVIAGVISAEAVASIGLVPGGLGTFEGTCVALLHAHGVDIEAALAGTVILRGLTFWLPMLPGLWMARREVRVHAVDEDAEPVQIVSDADSQNHSRRTSDGQTA